MKRRIKIILLFYFLFADFMLFAQIGSPGDDDTNGVNGLEGGDPQAATINAQLWFFIMLAFVYAFVKLKKKPSKKVKA